ncbi:alcohol dehydrogenase catalytic domain-containing protein [Nocardioides sp. LHD-245]|uniref:alcohol dehydrogenase catalytic domain-containing protein n=1 Tax=Nocardioides sp. LHD-245 TaxID=3051387 RepID=UPI0027DF0516|nr:alcohol dehydrogenase catalytic domain-containing protein [Nocardioides sp. LHD-245]
MKALVFTAAGQVDYREVPEPVAGPGEVLVDVRVAGVCGSDVHGVHSPGFRVPPLVLGHELAGEVGSRRVAVNPLLTCGRCAACGTGSSFLCAERALIGVHRPGGLAPRIAVPADSLVDLGAGTSWRAASAVEPTANVVHALRIAGSDLSPRARVAVLGAGAIGLLTLQLLRRRGVEDVTVVDLAETRRREAVRLGARATDLQGTYDVTIDAAGTAATRSGALSHLRPGGLSVWIGLASAEAGFDATDLVRQGKRVSGCFAYSREDFRAAVAEVDHLDLTWVDLLPMTDCAEEFRELLAGRSSRLKAVFRTDSVPEDGDA